MLNTASSRQRSVSEVITSAVEIGLPVFIRQFPAVASRSGTGQIHTVTNLTPGLATRMTELNIPSKGKTLSGHFSPAAAIAVIEAAISRGMPVGRVLKTAVRLGLPELKKEFRPVRAA